MAEIENVEWYDNPAYRWTQRVDTVIVLVILIAYMILLVISNITIQNALILLLPVGFFVSLVWISGKYRTPLRIGLSSNGIHITRGVRKKTSFVRWSDVDSIRVTRVVPSFVEPKEQVAVMIRLSGTHFLKIPTEMMVSVVKDLARKIVAASGKPLKKGSEAFLV